MIKKELFLTVNNLRKRIEELEKKLFEIQNPTKFEIGQKINYTPSTYWQLNVWDALGSSFPAIILKQEITNSSIGFRRSYEIYDLQRKEYYSISENQINEVQEEKS